MSSYVLRLLAVALVVSVGLGLSAFAASLGTSSKTLGSKNVTVAKCTSGSWTLAPVGPPGATVTGITVSGVASACVTAGDTVLVVASGTSSSLAQGSATLTAASETTGQTVNFTSCSGTCTSSAISTSVVNRIAAAVGGP